MYLNFGEIGSNIKQLVESFTKQKSITQKVDSIQGKNLCTRNLKI